MKWKGLIFLAIATIQGQPRAKPHRGACVSAHATNPIAWNHHGAHRHGWTNWQWTEVGRAMEHNFCEICGCKILEISVCLIFFCKY